MLTNLAKDCIIDVWRVPEFASECNSVKSYKNLAAEAVPGGIYLLKVDNRNSRQRSEICSKLTICSGIFIVNFEHVSHLVLVFLLITLNM